MHYFERSKTTEIGNKDLIRSSTKNEYEELAKLNYNYDRN